MDRYGGRISKSKRSFAALLKYMVDSDGLTDAQIPMVVRCGGTALGQLTGETHPTLAERRNSMAHGDPFDGLPPHGQSLSTALRIPANPHFVAASCEAKTACQNEDHRSIDVW